MKGFWVDQCQILLSHRGANMLTTCEIEVVKSPYERIRPFRSGIGCIAVIIPHQTRTPERPANVPPDGLPRRHCERRRTHL